MYKPATPTAGFGDILSAAWFHSAYVRRDATPLEVGPVLGGGKRTWRESTPAASRDLLLAHGRPTTVVLLSDPCEIESVLTDRGGKRLLVAGITEWNSEADRWHAEGRQRDFRRHLFPPADGYGGGVVQFTALFQVVAACIAQAQRDWSLDRGAQINLEAAWEAYAVRRGPRAVADNARKLGALLTADGDDVIAGDVIAGSAPMEQGAVKVQSLVEEVLDIAWDIEGALLNDVSDTLELGTKGALSEVEFKARTDARRTALRDAFATLRDASARAADSLGGDQQVSAAAPTTA